MATGQRSVRLAAVGDLHTTRWWRGALQPLFGQISDRADVLLLCGDMTDAGQPDEAAVLVKNNRATGRESEASPFALATRGRGVRNHRRGAPNRIA